MSWDEFIHVLQHSPDKKDAPIHLFIGECMEEHRQRVQRVKDESGDNQSAYAGNPRLINWIGKKKLENAEKGKDKDKMHCMTCGCDNHITENCFHTGKIKCYKCKKFRHKKAECHSKIKSEGSQKSKDQKVADTTLIKKESHIAEMAESSKKAEKDILLIISDENPMITDDSKIKEDVYDDMYMHDAFIGVNFSSHMYDWLVDSGSTNHIVNDRQLFTTFQPMRNTIVYGIGSKTSKVLERGTVPLIARNGEFTNQITLKDANYIPENRYCILSLRCWDADGRRYTAANGNLTLYSELQK